MKKTILLVVTSLMFMGHAYADDVAFSEGKKLFQENCLKCHDAQLDPPKAPPMFAVQRHYKMASSDRDDFIERITAFATHPSKEKALLKKPVQILGLMPEQGFDENEVRKIAAYLHDESFAPPCKHWQVAMRIFKEKGDMKAYKKHKKHFQRMCTSDGKPKEGAVMPMMGDKGKGKGCEQGEATVGSLKAIMQQLGKDYAAIDHAILLQDFDAAADAAHGIAYHDKPSMATKMKLMANLGVEMKGFKKADGKVHHLAKEVEAAAQAKDMKTLIQKQSQMLSACMACHSSYRSKVMAILK